MATIQDFRAEIANRNIHRQNLYEVVIQPPPGLKTETNLINLFCASAGTPDTHLSTNDNYTEAGVRRKYAYDQDSTNLILYFYLDQNVETKKIFDQWMRLINPTDRRFNYPKDYTSDSITVYILDQSGTRTYRYTYKNIYPKVNSRIDLSSNPTNSPTIFGIEFVHEWYEEGTP